MKSNELKNEIGLTNEEKAIFKLIFKIVGGFVGIILVLIILSNVIVIVNSGEVGVSRTLGIFNNQELNPGIHLIFFPIQYVQIINIKTQELDESLSVPSSEGLIVGLDVSVIYHIDSNLASELKQTVSGKPEETLLIPYTRNIVRDVVGSRTVKDVYSEGRNVVAKITLQELKNRLDSRGVIVEDVLLRDVVIPQKVKQAIELKLQKEQEALQKVFEITAAEKDAEILIIEANAKAKSQKIIISTLTPEFLNYLWISNIRENNNTIYVATEANLPIFRQG